MLYHYQIIKIQQQVATLKESSLGQWSSTLGFIFAGAGAAIGLSNFWGFAPLVAQHGGGAFFIVFFLSLLLMGLPLLLCEIILGRRGRQNPVSTMQTLGIMAGQHPSWRYLGLGCVLTVFLVLSYYSVMYGWSLGFLFRTMAGRFNNQNAQEVNNILFGFVTNPELLFAWHSVFMVITVLIVARGVKHSIEIANKIMVIAILVILCVLFIYSVSSDKFSAALEQLFVVDFSNLSMRAVFEAMKLAFFSLSAGFGIYLVYGTYLSRRSSIFNSAISIILIDLVVAMLGAVFIYTLLAEQQLALPEGASLVFSTLPLAFGHLKGGVIIGSLFYLMLLMVALTSSIALLETAMTWICEKFNWTRLRAAWVVGVSIWAMGIITALSFYESSPLRFTFKYAHQKREFGLFSVLEIVTADIMLPVLAFAMVIFIARHMNPQSSRDELNIRHRLVYNLWRGSITYVAPAMIVLVCLYLNGFIHFS